MTIRKHYLVHVRTLEASSNAMEEQTETTRKGRGGGAEMRRDKERGPKNDFYKADGVPQELKYPQKKAAVAAGVVVAVVIVAGTCSCC